MDEPTRLTPPTVVDVHFVLLDDSLILDWAGPAEALRMANQSLLAKGRPAAFALHFTGPRAETVSSVGARVSHLAPLPDLSQPQRPQWVVLVGQPKAIAMAVRNNKVTERYTGLRERLLEGALAHTWPAVSL